MSTPLQTIMQMMQQQGAQPAPGPTEPVPEDERGQRMLSMLGILSGDSALANFGKANLDDIERQAAERQRTEQIAYQRGQDAVNTNLSLARLSQGDSEQQQNRQLRRDALAQALREFNERQQAVKDQADAALLDPNTLTVAAHDVIVDPNHMRTYASGNSKAAQAVRKQINDTIPQLLSDAGMTYADLPSLRANAKAQAGSTQDLVKQQNAIAAYADPEVQNFQRLNELARKVDTTGIPFIERFLRPGKVAMGDPDAAEFQSLLTSTRTGAARLLNNPALNGVLSDSARDEMKPVIDGSASPDQMLRVLNRVSLEIGNRRGSINNQLNQAGLQMRNLSNVSNVPGAQGYQGNTGGASGSWDGSNTSPAAATTIRPPGGSAPENWVIGPDGKPQLSQ